MQYLDDEDEDELESGRAKRGRRETRHRNEGRYARPAGPLNAKAKKALALILLRTASGEGVRLSDINRALGEAPDHRGTWTTIISLRARGLIAYHGPLSSLRVPNPEAARSALEGPCGR